MSTRTVPPLVLAAELGRYASSRFDWGSPEKVDTVSLIAD